MKEEDLDALFRQKRNAEETVSRAEVSEWLNVGVVAGAGVAAIAGAKWLITKKMLFMTFGIFTVAGAVVTATIYLAARGTNPVAAHEPKSLMHLPAAIRSVETDSQSVTVTNTSEPASSLPASSPLAKNNSRLPVISADDTIIQLENFDRIVTKGFVRVTIAQGPECKIEMQDNSENWLSWEVENGKLILQGSDADRPKKLIVYVKELKELRLTGFSQAVITNGFSLDDLRLEMEGASGCSMASHVNDLTLALRGNCEANIDSDVENAELIVSGMSKVELSGKMGSVDIELHGMAEIDLKGSAKVSRISISGLSKLHATGCEVTDMDLDVSGESFAEVNVSHHLKTSESGTSTVIYSNEPQSVLRKKDYRQSSE